MTIDGVELRRLNHAEAGKDPERFTPLWEGVVPASAPPSATHATLIVQVIASDGLDPVVGDVVLHNVTVGVNEVVEVFGLSYALTISTPNLFMSPGDLIQVQGRPRTTGAVWIDRATLTISSAELAGSTVVDPGVPLQVTDLNAAAGDGTVLLTWTAPPQPTTRRGYRRSAAGGPWVESWSSFPYTASQPMSHSDGTVTNDVEYEYQVAHGNDLGDGPWSGSQFATPQVGAGLPPEAITNLTLVEADQLLALATHRYSSSSIATGTEQTLPNLNGTGDFQRGSTAGVDVNDPLFLPHTGEDYVEGQLGALNYVAVTPSATVADGTAIGFDIRVDGLARSNGSYLLGDRQVHLGVSANTSGSVTLRWQEAGGGAFPSLTTGTVLTLGVRSQIRLVTTFGGNTLTYSRASGPDLVSDVGWTLVSTQTGGPASLDVIDGLAVLTNRTDGGGGQSTSDDGRVFGARWSISTASDTIVTVFDPSDTSNFTVSRSATGLKTALVTRPLAMSDGVDDYGQLPASATPTFTKTSGKHTGLVLLRDWQDNNFRRIYSSETGNLNGLSIQLNDTGVLVYCGDGATFAARSLPRPADGVLFVAAFVVNEGQLAVYTSESGLGANIALSGITGAITHGVPRLMSLAYSAAGAAVEFFDFLDFPGKALTAFELDALSARMIAGTI